MQPTRAPHTAKLLAFFDWDGVFNVLVSNSQARARGLRRFGVRAASSGLTYTHRAQVWLNNAELASRWPMLAPVWATSWWDQVNTHLGNRIGLGPWPSVNLAYYNDDPKASKVDGIAAFAQGRPFVWFDDDPTAGDLDRLADLDHPALLIDIDPTHGIAPEHLDRAARFAADLGRTG